jgi:hypothetical protein
LATFLAADDGLEHQDEEIDGATVERIVRSVSMPDFEQPPANDAGTEMPVQSLPAGIFNRISSRFGRNVVALTATDVPSETCSVADDLLEHRDEEIHGEMTMRIVRSVSLPDFEQPFADDAEAEATVQSRPIGIFSRISGRLGRKTTVIPTPDVPSERCSAADGE